MTLLQLASIYLKELQGLCTVLDWGLWETIIPGFPFCSVKENCFQTLSLHQVKGVQGKHGLVQ